MFVLSGFRCRDGTSEVKPRSEFAINGDFSRKKVRCRDNFVQRDFHLNRFARSNHPFEFSIVDPRSDRNMAILRRKAAKQNRAALETTFTENDSRHQREPGKVSLDEELIRRERFLANDSIIGLRDHSIH